MQFSGKAKKAAQRPSGTARRIAVPVALALFALLVAAPGAFAWHGKLIVKKVVVDPTGSSTGKKFDFKVSRSGWSSTFQLAGGGVKTFDSLDSGGETITGSGTTRNWIPYTIAETANPDYTTAISCTGPSSLTGTYGGWGYTVNGTGVVTSLRWKDNTAYTTTCTFTNTRKTAKLELRKTVVPAADPGTFDLSADGPTPVSKTDAGNGATSGVQTVGAGDYTLSETAAAGTDADAYEMGAVSCHDRATGDTVAVTAGVVHLDAGADVWCGWTNTRKGTVKLVKQLTPAADSGFDLKLDGTVVADDVGDGGQSAIIPVSAGAHAISEAVNDDETDSLDNYDTSVACVKPGAEDSTVPVPVVDGSIQVANGDNVVCTFTNTKKGRVTIGKLTDPSGSTQEFAFTSETLGGFSLTDKATKSFLVSAGAYGVTETVTRGWTLQGVTCSDSDQGEGDASTIDGSTVTVRVQPGEAVTCTYTNKQETTPPETPLTPPSSSGNPSSDVSPVTPSGGVTTPRASARLRGTVGCAAKYSTASVAGASIKRVTFYLDGKKVKVVKVGASGGATIRITTKTLRYGTHKLKAKVEFLPASRAKARNYSLSFSRCKSRAVQPKFTG